MSDIMVSICCLAYNHEKYIRKALEGFVNQKTNFKYEILIHDDASTDGTADIIREYEAKYPEIIKPIYQTENQYSKKVRISLTYQYPRAKGKYIAWCEGDDYWCSETKLQEQFDIMEANPEVVICTHKIDTINEMGEKRGYTYPREDSGIIEGKIHSEEFTKMLLSYNKYPFQTCSYFIRKDIILDMVDSGAAFLKSYPAGDTMLLWYTSTRGDLYYLDKVHSCYRKGSEGSWTSRMENDKFKLAYYEKVIQGYKDFDKFTEYKYSDLIKDDITYIEGCSFMLKGDTKSLMKREYKEFRKQLGLKQKVHYILKVYFNPLFKMIVKAKNRRYNN